MRRHPLVVGIIGGIVRTVLLAIAVWLTIVYTGAYNVAASDQHGDVVRWTLDTTVHRSIATRASRIEIPETLSDRMIAEGAGHYAKSCAHCHGGPGAEPADWSRGMRPEPPRLTKAATEWSPGEIQWIVSNGLKMSGMPAFGSHHSANEISALTAFVSALPGLSPEKYAALTSSGGHSHETTEPPGD